MATIRSQLRDDHPRPGPSPSPMFGPFNCSYDWEIGQGVERTQRERENRLLTRLMSLDRSWTVWRHVWRAFSFNNERQYDEQARWWWPKFMAQISACKLSDYRLNCYGDLSTGCSPFSIGLSSNLLNCSNGFRLPLRSWIIIEKLDPSRLGAAAVLEECGSCCLING